MAEEKVANINKNVQDFKSKSGAEYKFQKVAPVEWLDILDDVEDGSKKGQRRRLYGAVMENVVVAPKMELADFEDFAEMDEVVTAGIRFQQGK